MAMNGTLRGLTTEQIQRARTTTWTNRRADGGTYVYFVVVVSRRERYPICLGPAESPAVHKMAQELLATPVHDIITNEAIHARIEALHQQNRKAAGMNKRMAACRVAWRDAFTGRANSLIRLPFLPGECDAGSRVWQALHADEVRDYERQERAHMQRVLARELFATLYRERPEQADAVWREIVEEGQPAAEWSTEAQAGLRALREMAGLEAARETIKQNGDELLLVDLIEITSPRRRRITYIKIKAKDLPRLLAERPVTAQLVMFPDYTEWETGVLS